MKISGIRILAVSAMIAILPAACKPDGEGGTVTGVKISESAVTVGPGAPHSLTATVLPKNAANKNVIWESDNPEILWVSNGTVVGLKEGTAHAVVTTLDQFMTASCEVTVKANQPSEKITVLKDITVKAGDTSEPILYRVDPDGCNVGALFTSNNTKIATVTPDGRVKGVAVGTTKIVCSAGDNSSNYGKCNVNVVNELIYPTKARFVNVPSDVQVGQTVTILKTPPPYGTSPYIVVEPENVNVMEYTVHADNSGKLSIVEDATSYSVTALKKGAPSLYIETANGFSQMITIYIHDGAPAIKVDNSTPEYWEEYSYYGNKYPLLVLNEGNNPFQLKFIFENIDKNNQKLSFKKDYTYQGDGALSISDEGVVTPNNFYSSSVEKEFQVRASLQSAPAVFTDLYVLLYKKPTSLSAKPTSVSLKSGASTKVIVTTNHAYARYYITVTGPAGNLTVKDLATSAESGGDKRYWNRVYQLTAGNLSSETKVDFIIKHKDYPELSVTVPVTITP